MGSLAKIKKDAGEFEAGVLEERAFLDVLDEALAALERNDIPYLLIGGLASSALGRPRWTHDIDVFVTPDDAPAALEALARAGFKTEKTDPNWLFKAVKDGALVDVIFQSKGHIYLDDGMMRRARTVEYRGRWLRVMAPEDLIVLKAMVHDEHVGHHWHDALGVIAARDLDSDYLVVRAMQHGARRVLSLLLYAQSVAPGARGPQRDDRPGIRARTGSGDAVVIRIAALADIHFGVDSSGMLRSQIEEIENRADVLLIAGDLTRAGRPDEAAVLARELD